MLFLFVLFGIMLGLSACDASEQPFVMTNNLPQRAYVQILEQSAPNKAGFPLQVAQKGQILEKRLLIEPGEAASMYTDGVVGGRIGYVVVISDEGGKELSRNTFPRDSLIKHKFRLTIAEQGIQYSP